jgi:hypothetical protein
LSVGFLPQQFGGGRGVALADALAGVLKYQMRQTVEWGIA